MGASTSKQEEELIELDADGILRPRAAGSFRQGSSATHAATTNAAFGAHSRLIATLPTLRDEPRLLIPSPNACVSPPVSWLGAHRRDGCGAGHWENVWASAAHPASNTYLGRRVPDEPGDFWEAGEDASREPTMGARSHAGHERNDGEEEDESWRSEPRFLHRRPALPEPFCQSTRGPTCTVA